MLADDDTRRPCVNILLWKIRGAKSDDRALFEREPAHLNERRVVPHADVHPEHSALGEGFLGIGAYRIGVGGRR